MKRTRQLLSASLLRDQRGLTTVEYIIVLCLVAIVGFAAWQKFGTTVKGKVRTSDGILNGVGPGH